MSGNGNGNRLAAEFPILAEEVGGRPLVYLDSAATTQKPRQVIAAVSAFYEEANSNVHRGIHLLSERATERFEGAREKVRAFINASEAREVVFVRGTTEAINLVAGSFGRDRIDPGDEIVITHMEHHSNIVPWQLLCEQTGAVLKVAPISDEGEVLMDAYADLVGPRTKLVSIVHVSNSLGTVNPVVEMTSIAHDAGALVLLDGAQAIAHRDIDVQALDCDFFAFSGHKLYGPTGIGVLYGKAEILESMAPYQGGGEMILSVSFEGTTYNHIPGRFEAGTPNVAGAVGLGAAVDFMMGLDREALRADEQDLLAYAADGLASVPGLRIVGSPKEKSGAHSFVIEGIHPHDIGTVLDSEGVAVRTGHHCTQPLMERLGLVATARASFGVYSTRYDVDRLIEGLGKVHEVLG
ncbi:MAG: cysteine desulfurase [Deltaproteobacteria bacterium]